MSASEYNNDDQNPFRNPSISMIDSPTVPLERPVALPATPQRVYRLYERPMSASPAPSYHSNQGTPPRPSTHSADLSNPFGTPYSPRYFEQTPNGSIHRPSSRTSTPTRFSTISPRKLPPPPVFPDLRSVSPLNSVTTNNHYDSHVEDESDRSDVEYDNDNADYATSDFGFIMGLDPPRVDSPATIVGSDYAMPRTEHTEYEQEDYDDDYDESLDEKLQDTRHYGPAPVQPQPRRHNAMAKRQVQLVGGNLVLDNPVPSKLTSFLPRRDSEFTHMRYTAATCDPDDFATDGYTLRPSLLGRETQLFIAVTMYNEDEILFTRTMHGIMRNIAHLCSRSRSRVWGKDGWQKVVVCVVADGRKDIHPRVLDVLAAMGVYQDGIAKNLVNGKEVKAHIYEYTTQISVDPDLRFQGAEKGMVPVQVLFCLKEKNAKKLNSHRWFFNAFGPVLNPNVCVLMDVGTRPGGKSIYHLWKAFDHNSNVGGACGEIKAMKGKAWSALLNPLVAAQNFEYKMSNILDKPTESVFGYITVLPGAFSAYRYIALKNDSDGKGPLASYFKGEKLHGKEADVFTANMYLAEDRILCWELVAKRNEKWILEYVKSATGETDVPDAVPELVSQRRRWLNGAFFAAVYAQTHFTQIWQTDHSFRRKIALHVEFLYQFINLVFSFFSLANFYLTFYFVCSSLADPQVDPFGGGWAGRIFTFLRYLCVLLITSQFILSMGNRPQGARLLFTISMSGFSIIMAYTLFATIYLTVKSMKAVVSGSNSILGDDVFANMVVALLSTAGLYFLSSTLYMDPWHMFSSFLQFTLLLPSFVCTLQIYAFCNTYQPHLKLAHHSHDVSWGTKGDNVIHTDLGAAVSAGKGEKGDIVEVEVPSEQLDIDAAYDDALANVRERRPIAEKKVNASTLKEDYYREIRTRLVLIWIVSNATLSMALTEVYSTGLSGTNGYLKFILWAIAGLSAFRFIGSTTYLLVNMVQRTAGSKYFRKFSDA